MKTNPNGYRYVRSPVIRLKDKKDRNVTFIVLKESFDEMPDVIAIEKVQGKNNAITVTGWIPKNGDAK